MKSLRPYLLLAFLVACNADDMTSKPASPDFGGGTDAFGAAPIDAAKVAALQERAKTFIKPGSIMQVEGRLGVPTFVWAKAPITVTSPTRARWISQGVAKPEVAAAKDAVRNLASLYSLSDDDVTSAHVEYVDTRKAGPTIVKMKTQIGGIEIFREEMNVILDKNLDAIAVTGYLSSPQTPSARTGAMDFALTPAQAAARALGHMAQTTIDPVQIAPLGSRDAYDRFNVIPAAGIALADPIRVKRYYFHVPSGLEAAYYVEVSAYTGAPPDNVALIDGDLKQLEAYAYLVSASTGQLLTRSSQIANETYRIWGDPTTQFPDDTASGHLQHPKVNPVPDGTQPPFVPTADITLANFPFSQTATDPWLPPGATETNGNNVDAFVDLVTGGLNNANDGYGPATTTTPTDFGAQDYRAQITSPGQFLHTQVPDVNSGTAEGRQASIQHLFYANNFLHDWYYDAGFNEAAGNAQKNNFGRGGLENDDIRAEAQDSSNINNANMLTPADGQRPRMQMFPWPHVGNYLESAAVGGKIQISEAFQGVQQFTLTNELVPAVFDAACNISNAAAIAGKIVLLNRNLAACSLGTQLSRAESSAAIGSVIQNNGTGLTIFIGAPSPTLTKPIVVVTNANGNLLRSAAPPVNVTIQRFADRDGALDTQIVFHEWMHYMSNRLIGNGGGGLNTTQAGGMGEGWGDTNAMLLTVREEDTSVPSNTSYNGVYALATHALGGNIFNGTPNNSLYFGIRRYPYSTDMTKNPLTFKHIQNGVALPPGIPVLANSAPNAEVHNTGEIWAQMNWECYAAILRDTQGPTPRLTFKQAQDRWRAYLVAGMKTTPVVPTFLEARDALLAVMVASDVDDYITCRNAFAKRGAGSTATGPDRFSTTNTPVVEDFTVIPEMAVESASFDDSLGSCDNDGVVDHGEYGKLTVTVRNRGITPLTGTTLDVSTTSAGMWFPSGTTATFSTIAVGQTGTAFVRVALPPGSTGIQQVDFNVTVTNAAVPTFNGVASFRVDTDDVLASSATDDVEANTTTWTRDFNPALKDLAPWSRSEVTALSHVLAVADPNGGADERVYSPVLTINGSGTLTLTFQHQWQFEFAPSNNFDGGVVEMAVNGGPFTDLGSSATAGGYNGTLITFTGNQNPLAGRQAFVASSGGLVTTTISRAIAPGSTVQVRFRMGSDNSGAGGGWNIDNIAFGGVVETPFATLVQDPDSCAVVPASADLQITKTDGVASLMVGGSTTYTITAANAGPGNIIGATVTDNFAPDLTCTWTCAGAGGGVCGSASGSGNILDKPTLPSGGSTTYTATCTLAVTTSLLSLTNTATIANPGPVTDPNPANNTATDVDAVIRLPAHLTGTKTVAGTFTLGGTVTYTVILTNDGTGKQFDNPGFEFVDPISGGLIPQTASASSGVATLSGGTVFWNGEIDAGGSVTITIVATINAPPGATISNQGTFSYDNDGNGTNESSGVTDAFPCP